MLKSGIIGLPNVGKSSLFSLITKNQVLIANYPFATIEPNIGVVKLLDDRIEKLAKFYKTSKIIHAVVSFYDIAGLLAGASKGEGLGNQFLSHIRESNILIHVVRAFVNNDVVHVDDKIDPAKDFQTVNKELIIADQLIVEKHIAHLRKSQKKLTMTEKKQTEAKIIFFEDIKQKLTKQQMLFSLHFSFSERKWLKHLNLLTLKKMLVLINVHVHMMNERFCSPQTLNFIKYLKKENIPFLLMPIQYELEMRKFSVEERKVYQAEFGVDCEGIKKLTQAAYKLLNLGTFFTASSKEIKAWSFPIGATARDCAGIIHTDFATHFIKCRLIAFQKLISFETESKAQEAGVIQNAGADHLIADGDICHFLFGANKKT